ncbi:hypothetical protein BTUL_0012g00540 [Botrytis tulipae]|uniref:Uncharacterized protein n=1 Tax=Botrytis tulipae TaxID=87230 RepID=A0A4Z1F353_9HELO|nr:hypothetical protein BTUL_0012g00540 [Botrytis tulipae]
MERSIRPGNTHAERILTLESRVTIIDTLTSISFLELFGPTIVGASEATRPEAPKIPKDPQLYW